MPIKLKLTSVLTGILINLLILVPVVLNAQSEKKVIEKYLSELSTDSVVKTQQKYQMTAIYTNRDLYGKFTGKIKVCGDYTRGLENGFARWNNVYVASSNSFSEPFPVGTKQEYVENMTYVPSSKMLEKETFRDFPQVTETVFVRNLIWDMMAIEGFAWNYTDSLELNKIYRIPKMHGEFEMGDIGKYNHLETQLCWTGISAIEDELFALLDFRAIDNIVEISMESMKTKGTEQYWGTVWVSLKTRELGKAVMYSGTIQEIEVPGFDNKFIAKTIRELWVIKIQ